MQCIADGEHGTYIVAHSKKALAFFFCVRSGQDQITDDLGAQRIAAEKSQHHRISEIFVQAWESAVYRLKKKREKMKSMEFVHASGKQKEGEEGWHNGSGPKQQSALRSFDTKIRK